MTPIRVARPFRTPVLWLIVLGCALSTAIVAAGPGSGGGSKRADDFIGLWQGVDGFDGSPVRLSVSDIDGDGVLEHVMQEDFFSYCANLGSGYSKGRGVVNGSATVASKYVLNTLTELTCISDDNIPAPQGASPLQYTLESRGRNLVLPGIGSLPGMVLHRVAQ